MKGFQLIQTEQVPAITCYLPPLTKKYRVRWRLLCIVLLGIAQVCAPPPVSQCQVATSFLTRCSNFVDLYFEELQT